MTTTRALRTLLRPFSLAYGMVVGAKAALYRNGVLKQKRLKGAVISVGNLTVGGTGKTPMIIWLTEKLLSRNLRVAILTRGYQGVGGTSDEVEVMRSRLQNRAAIGVGQDRFAEGARLEAGEKIDVFLLDDGFQHLRLARDFDIVLIDASQPMNEPLLPAGPMRERMSSLARADAIVFTRSENAAGMKQAVGRLSNLPVFAASTRLRAVRPLVSESLRVSRDEVVGMGPFLAFCAIGNPQAFFNDLSRWGIPVKQRLSFRDHHRYAPPDVQRIEREARGCGAKGLMTTEKDVWNLSGVKFSLPVFVCDIDLEVTNEAEFLAVVDEKLRAHKAVA
jgi:tetraacyldisaccharide 4'-kinase